MSYYDRTQPCQWCSEPMKNPRYGTRFCSTRCRVAAHRLSEGDYCDLRSRHGGIRHAYGPSVYVAVTRTAWELPSDTERSQPLPIEAARR